MSTHRSNTFQFALNTESLDVSDYDSDSDVTSPVFDYDHAEGSASDKRIEVDDIKDFFDAETTLYEGNLNPPEYYRQALEPWDNGNPYAGVNYSEGSTILLDSIEKKWIA